MCLCVDVCVRDTMNLPVIVCGCVGVEDTLSVPVCVRDTIETINGVINVQLCHNTLTQLMYVLWATTLIRVFLLSTAEGKGKGLFMVLSSGNARGLRTPCVHHKGLT